MTASPGRRTFDLCSSVSSPDRMDSRGAGKVAFAAKLARETGASLSLVAAHVPLPLPFPGGVRVETDDTERAIRALRDELAPGPSVEVVATHSPARAIAQVAMAHRADLVVIGSHRPRRFERFLGRNHALEVLRATSASVAVVPDGCDVRPLTRISVEVDDSPEAAVALDVAATLAHRRTACLRLVPVPRDQRVLAEVFATADLLVVSGRAAEDVVRHARGPILVAVGRPRHTDTRPAAAQDGSPAPVSSV
jgi:nucleotide-binding universal stress UspA family protein